MDPSRVKVMCPWIRRRTLVRIFHVSYTPLLHSSSCCWPVFGNFIVGLTLIDHSDKLRRWIHTTNATSSFNSIEQAFDQGCLCWFISHSGSESLQPLHRSLYWLQSLPWFSARHDRVSSNSRSNEFDVREENRWAWVKLSCLLWRFIHQRSDLNNQIHGRTSRISIQPQFRVRIFLYFHSVIVKLL